MKFYTTTVKEIDRHTEEMLGSKHEEITISVKLIGNGDTRNFSTTEILSIVHNRLAEIEPIKP